MIAKKLEQKVIDFEKLEDAGLKDGKWDVVFITFVLSGGLLWNMHAELSPCAASERPASRQVVQRHSRKLTASTCSLPSLRLNDFSW